MQGKQNILTHRRRTESFNGTKSLPAKVPPLRTRSSSALPMYEPTSEELMQELAVPKVFRGPTVDVQNEIVRGIETQINLLGEDEQKLYAANTCVGGIELTVSPDSDLSELIAGARLIDLKGNCVGKSSFDLAKAAGVEKQIITNTLSTMEKAGQLDYFRKSGLINDEWKVIVEVHYYRDRDKGQTRFHKDTMGQTLFVNLNFVNDEEVAGPEFVINPGSTEKYDKHVSDHLPPAFVKDLKKAKEVLGVPEYIGSTTIPRHGVVTFVDEAIHHKTPTLGHRTASGGAIAMALSAKCPAEYKNVKEGYEKYKKRWTNWWTFDSFIDKKYKKNADAWFKLLSKIDNSLVRLNRTELKSLLPKIDSLDMDSLIEELIEAGGSGDFGQVNFNLTKELNVPVKRVGQAPLRRQMSQKLLTGTAPQPVPGKRTFFRTWVRAVRK